MQASDFDSPREAYFSSTALPLDQQLSQNFGSLNALPKEIISLIFNEGLFSELRETRLVSKSCSQIVDTEYKKVKSIALENFERVRPYIRSLYCNKDYMDPYFTTNFVLDKEGNLVALSGSDKIMFVKDEEGNFKQTNNLIPSDEHSTLSVGWSKMYRFAQSLKISNIPETGFAKKVAEAMVSLALPLFEGSFALAHQNRNPDQHFVDWKTVFHNQAEFTTRAILETGRQRLQSK